MDSDGTQDARGTHATPVPRPAMPPEAPAVPPRPAWEPGVPPQQEHGRGEAVAAWLDEARPEAGTGIWRFGYRMPKAGLNGERLAPVTVVGMLIPLAVALVVWSFWRRGAIPYQYTFLRLFTPDDWWWGGTLASPKRLEDQSIQYPGVEALQVYNGLFFALLVYAVGRLGGWWPSSATWWATGPSPPAPCSPPSAPSSPSASCSRTPSPASAGTPCRS